MKKTQKRLITVVAAIAAASAAISGCNKDRQTASEAKLTYWAPFYTHYSKMGTNMGNAPFYKELMEKTGVQIEFIHPPVGDEESNFNLLVASGDLPDLIEYSFLSYKGGPEKAIDDNIILEIGQYLKEKSPNLYKVLQEHPEWDKQVKTDSDKYYCFPAIRGDEFLDYWNGPQVRKDYLDKAGLEAPETVEEWENMLIVFKETLGVETPLTLKSANNYTHIFAGAYGITTSFFLKDGRVTFGPMTDEYESYLKLMNSWVEKGLLDSDYATHDAKTLDAQIASGKAGAWVGSVGGDMGKYITATKANDENAAIIAVKPPVLKKGSKPEIGYKDFDYVPGQSVSVSTDCQDIDSVFKFMDYAYGEEGHMFFNFGVEGISYNMIDGYPTYVDSIIHPEEGTTVYQAMTEYTRAAVMGPMIQDKRYFEQYMVNAEQKESADAWKLDGDAQWRMPNITFTIEESNKIASKLTEISNYAMEMETKFILGAQPLSALEQYRRDLKSMGLEDVIAVMQTAVERYENR